MVLEYLMRTNNYLTNGCTYRLVELAKWWQIEHQIPNSTSFVNLSKSVLNRRTTKKLKLKYHECIVEMGFKERQPREYKDLKGMRIKRKLLQRRRVKAGEERLEILWAIF